MNKNKKTLFIIIIIILSFISVMSLIYGFMNVQRGKAAAEEQNQKYIDVVNDSVNKCKEYSSLLNNSDDYDTAVGYYAENIENAHNSALKAYIASAMVDYSINYFSTININEFGINSTKSKYSKYMPAIDELNSLKTQLANLE